MSVVPAIFNGLKGTRAIDTIGNLPSWGATNNGLTKVPLKLNWKKTSQLESPDCLIQSVLKSNQGGARGVLPCKGAVSLGSVCGNHRVLRRPAIPQEGGMYPQVGYARGQRLGLAFNVEKSISLPLFPQADSFNAGLNSTLGQPSFKVF